MMMPVTQLHVMKDTIISDNFETLTFYYVNK